MSDAANVMVYVGIPRDGNCQRHIEEALRAVEEAGCDATQMKRVREKGAKVGAVWHIFHAQDAEKIRELLKQVMVSGLLSCSSDLNIAVAVHSFLPTITG